MSGTLKSIVLAVSDAAHEPSEQEHDKTAFYVLGVVLAVWTVVISALGVMRAGFPGGAGGTRAIALVSVLLVVAVMAATVLTS